MHSYVIVRPCTEVQCVFPNGTTSVSEVKGRWPIELHKNAYPHLSVGKYFARNILRFLFLPQYSWKIGCRLNHEHGFIKMKGLRESIELMKDDHLKYLEVGRQIHFFFRSRSGKKTACDGITLSLQLDFTEGQFRRGVDYRDTS